MSYILLTVVYNNSRNVERCVDSFRSSFRESTVVIIDNSDKPQCVAEIKNKFSKIPDIYVLRPKKNQGYFAGFNFGLEFLNKKGLYFSHYFFSNDDIVFPLNFFQKFRHSKAYNCAAFAPNVLNCDGTNSNPHVIQWDQSLFQQFKMQLFFQSFFVSRLLSLILSIFLFFRVIKTFDNPPSQFVSQPHGSFFALNGETVSLIGKLPQYTFLYGEEFFLADLLRKVNLYFFYDNTITVFHSGSLSTSGIASRSRWLLMRDAWLLERSIRRNKAG